MESWIAAAGGPWNVAGFAVTGCCALVGHVVLWTFLVNQVSARDFPSFVTRSAEKGFLLIAAAGPAIVGLGWFESAFGDRSASHVRSIAFSAYAYACALVMLGAAARVATRRWWSTEVRVPTSRRVRAIRRDDGSRPVLGAMTRVLAALPMNEICELEINEKHLRIPGMSAELDGFTIAHLSDLHITGRMDRDFYRRVVHETLALNAESIAVTGDIIDVARHIDWLDLLGGLQAENGVYFVLGNHDKRVGHVEIVRRRLRARGWTSIGGIAAHAAWRGRTVLIAGNEMPWIGPPPSEPLPPGPAALRVALIHSPDQLPWARRLGFQLALAGHTHGGQVRLPGVGAVLTPSRNGTRYACGVFYERPTALHVSRGISALHPVRFGCRPELTRLILRSVPAPDHGSADTR